MFFHLAENKARADLPFAFLATYTSRISAQGKVQHLPLGRAVKEQAAAADKRALLALLAPVQRAAEASPFLRELVESRRIFQPQAWTPAEAHRFLRDLPLFEEKGIFVRVPDWWRSRNPPRLRVGVTVGRDQAAGLGADALLDFSVGLSLEGEKVSEEEWRRILAGTGDLALVKGRWVEVDREKLADLLRHWKAVEKEARRSGLPFREGLRLLARLPGGGGMAGAERAALEDPASRWLAVDSGEWLGELLQELGSPSGEASCLPGDSLRATLRPYQVDGVKWLWLLHKLRLGGCLADDMGLGKTVQALALLLQRAKEGPALVVAPTSVGFNWVEEA
ncbi:MAG: SNF2 helicase-associated domain-containing protein, partial [Thermoanaerobaculia bacterium]